MLQEETNRSTEIAFWCLAFALLLLTRLPATPQYLTIDNVNLAFALDNFDPRIHHPQPPGYPLFVLFGKLINMAFFHDAVLTFAAIRLAISALCLPLTFIVGRRMFGDWAGRAAALLLIVTPPFWYSSLDSPLRVFLALFSLLTAYCCWRCWHGEKTYMYWGAVALGIGSGFRPDLGGYLFPLWLLSAWMGTRSIVSLAKGLAVLAAVVFAWVGGMAYAVGGFGTLYTLNVDYLVQQSRQSMILGAAKPAWSKQLRRLAVWNGTAILGSVWAVPFYFRSKDRLSLFSSHGVFVFVWLLPGFLFQAFVHVEDPGHTLFATPALAIVAAYLIFVATRTSVEARGMFLAAAAIINTMLFVGFFELPDPVRAGGWTSIKKGFLYANAETSLGGIRYMDNVAIGTMAELRQFMPKDRPMVVVSTDVPVANWYMNWRIFRYYEPDVDIWMLADLQDPHLIQHVHRDKISTTARGSDLKIPIPRGGRVFWLLEPEGPFQRALKQVLPGLRGGYYLSYLDVAADTTAFRVEDFEFVPVE